MMCFEKIPTSANLIINHKKYNIYEKEIFFCIYCTGLSYNGNGC